MAISGTTMRDLEALVALIEGRSATPFAWGPNDCVTFAAHAVRAQTGVNPLKGLGRHRWRSAKGAARALAAHGGLEAAVDGVLPRIAPAMAHRGDVGLVEIDGRASLVVFEGATVVGPGLEGLERLPRSAVRAAWSAEASPA